LAIDALQNALELNPCLAVTYCGLGDSFAYEGRLDEAIEQFEIAIRLSPHDPFRWAFYSYRSLAHLFRGEFAEAASWARKATQIPNAQYWPWAHLVAALGHLGDENQSRSAVKDLLKIKPEFSLVRKHLSILALDQRNQSMTGSEAGGQKSAPVITTKAFWSPGFPVPRSKEGVGRGGCRARPWHVVCSQTARTVQRTARQFHGDTGPSLAASMPPHRPRRAVPNARVLLRRNA
jgi:tetratricopeptide (TPR) repeat protein